jgi:hypothetical protein
VEKEYNNNCQGAREIRPQHYQHRNSAFPTGAARKNFSKKFEKPLDKPLKMWYNKSVKRGRELKNNAKT